MIQYFEMPGLAGRRYFKCERLLASMSETSCADMWRSTNRDGAGRDSCRNCAIGAVHTGDTASSESPLKGRCVCARCHKPASRLIGGMHCVSCKNREYEWVKGRNAKGTRPVKLCALDRRRVRFMCGGLARDLVMPRSDSTEELVMATLRDSVERVSFFRPVHAWGNPQLSLW
jgi:hypothetical protein